MAAAAAVSLRRRQRTRITTMTLSLLSCLVLLSLLLPIASAQRLFFSSYTHTATNSIIEVFNPSCATAVTTEFDIRIATYSTHAAGSVWLAAIPLGGAATLLPQATRSVCRAAFAGCTTVNTGMVFSGQEAIGLFHNNVLIDIIGSITSMNGDACANCPSGRTNNAAPWLVAGVLSATFQHTLLRKPRVTEGTTDFFHPKGSSVINPSSSEWTVSAVGTNVLGTYPATRTNVCPNGAYIGLFYATCGTIGSSLPTTTSTLQVVCPVDCISRVTQHVVGTGYPRLSGSNGRYSLTTPVCLAAYHSNIVSYNGNSFPRASFTPQPTAGVIASICNYSPTSSQPLYTDASLFPSSSRPNGRPHLLVTFLPSTSQTFVGAVEQCIVSTSSTVTGGVNLQLLNSQSMRLTICSMLLFHPLLIFSYAPSLSSSHDVRPDSVRGDGSRSVLLSARRMLLSCCHAA
jgi:hypothetical protein